MYLLDGDLNQIYLYTHILYIIDCIVSSGALMLLVYFIFRLLVINSRRLNEKPKYAYTTHITQRYHIKIACVWIHHICYLFQMQILFLNGELKFFYIWRRSPKWLTIHSIPNTWVKRNGSKIPLICARAYTYFVWTQNLVE